MEPILMPKLALTMEEAKVVGWRKQEGEAVRKGEPLIEIETDKATTEIESPLNGFLGRILVTEGEMAAVEAVLGYLVSSREELAGNIPGPAKASSAAPRDTASDAGPPATAQNSRGKPFEAEAVRAAPAARKLARELGVDLGRVEGTGPGGRITPEDVRKATGDLQAPLPTDWLAQRKEIIAGLNRSLRLIPHINLLREVRVDAMVAFKQRVPKPSYTALLVKVMAEVIEEFPILKRALLEDQVYESPTTNVGVVMDTGAGLVIPVIKQAHCKSFEQIAGELLELTRKARQKQLAHSDLVGATVSVSNLGMYGIDWFTAIVPYGQAGILTIGRIRHQPRTGSAAEAGDHWMWINLVADHRLLDGVTVAGILDRLARRLQDEATWRETASP